MTLEKPLISACGVPIPVLHDRVPASWTTETYLESYYVVVLKDSEVERIAQRVVELLRTEPSSVNRA